MVSSVGDPGWARSPETTNSRRGFRQHAVEVSGSYATAANVPVLAPRLYAVTFPLRRGWWEYQLSGMTAE